MNARSMMTPWLHHPQKRSVPSPIYLMLILSLTLMPNQIPAAHAAPPPPAAHAASQPPAPHTPPPTTTAHTPPPPAPPHAAPPTPAAHPTPQIAPPHTPPLTTPPHAAPPTTPAHAAPPTTLPHAAPPTTPAHATPQIKSSPVILTSPFVILSEAKNLHPPQPMPTPKTSPTLADLEGTWEIQEEERTYVATLDVHGNGPYTHEGGTFTTTTLEGRRWSGKWSQTGNDREGEFEVLLSEDGSTAEGRWWYTRVGTFTHIPARVYGGSYLFKRQSPKTDSPGQPP